MDIEFIIAILFFIYVVGFLISGISNDFEGVVIHILWPIRVLKVFYLIRWHLLKSPITIWGSIARAVVKTWNSV